MLTGSIKDQVCTVLELLDDSFVMKSLYNFRNRERLIEDRKASYTCPENKMQNTRINNNELKRPAKQVVTCEAGEEA